MATEDDFARAGLLDSPHAGPDRPELLRWLDELGFTIGDMVVADVAGNLAALPGDRRVLPDVQRGHDEAIERSGLPTDVFEALGRALGIVAIRDAPDEVTYTDGEIELLRTVGAVRELFSLDEVLGLARVIGSAIARIGEAAVSTFLTDVESRLVGSRAELPLAREVLTATGMLDGLAAQLDPLLRRHVLQAIERSRRATVGDQRLQYRWAIGFVDLVGFTERTHQLEPAELATFVRDFEARAHDLVLTHGGRVVKLIGDEVMFAATEPDAICDAAAALVDGFGDPADVVPRGGLAWGDVLTRGGDYYGSVVNLASRLADAAVPREILATTTLADATGGDRFEPAGRRMVKGFVEPVEVRSLRLGT